MRFPCKQSKRTCIYKNMSFLLTSKSGRSIVIICKIGGIHMPNQVPENRRLNLYIENVKLNIDLNAGFFGFTPNHAIPHSHKYYEFHHMISGSVRLFCGEKQSVIHQNEAYIVAPNVLHYLLPQEERSLRNSFCFSFSKIKRNANFDLYDCLERAFSSCGNTLKVPVRADHVFFLNKIFTLFYSDKAIDRFKLKTYFVLLLTDIAESVIPSENTQNAESDGTLSESDVRHFVAEEFIRRNLTAGITLSDLAEVLHLSEKQAGRIFYREFGQSFKEYLLSMRLASAKSLLSDTSLSVNEIAERVGYRTYNGFYTMFVNKTAITPHEYRVIARKEK